MVAQHGAQVTEEAPRKMRASRFSFPHQENIISHCGNARWVLRTHSSRWKKLISHPEIVRSSY
jgi:hypothetical protein